MYLISLVLKMSSGNIATFFTPVQSTPTHSAPQISISIFISFSEFVINEIFSFRYCFGILFIPLVLLFKWKDNKDVILVSNFETIEIKSAK